MKIELDMYQTLALSVLVLLLGKFLRERVRVLEKFCIPAPVIGGVRIPTGNGQEVRLRQGASLADLA